VLFLVFQLGGERYLLDSAEVAEVLPLVELKRIPRAPAGVAGVLRFRGGTVPVVDLGEVALGRPVERRLSTRIILAHYATPRGDKKLLGLVAERVTDTVRRDRSDFAPAGVTSPDAPYLGPLTRDEHGLMQWILVEQLLPESVRAALFQEVEEA
jgi:chemotaxis-related protein WspB